MFDSEKTFWWSMAAAGALTVGAIWYFAASSDDEHPVQAVQLPAPATTGTAVAPVAPNTVYVTQPHHDGTSDLVNGMLIGNMLRGNDSHSTHTVQHVYHPAPAPAYHPPAPVAPKPVAAPAPSRPSYTPVSRPASAIRTTSSPARSMSRSRFSSGGRR